VQEIEQNIVTQATADGRIGFWDHL